MMIALHHYKNKTVAVFGLGKSGIATIHALIAGGAEVYAWDDKPESVAAAQEACPQAIYKNFGEWSWKNHRIEVLVLAPGVPLSYPQPHLVVQLATIHGCRIVGDIELLAESCPDATFIGITGTNGKSTTTALIGHLLTAAGKSCQIGGNLGTPALSLEPLGAGGCYVLEVSSYQLDLLASAHFNLAVLLNITPDHLDRHGGMEGYITAKRRIFDGQTAKDTAIIGIDSPACREIWQELRSGKHRFAWQGKGAKVVGVSTKKPVADGIFVHNGVIEEGIPAQPSTLDITAIVSLLGEHNWQNAGAAFAVCRAMGLAATDIVEGMRSFGGLDHRMKRLATLGDVCFVNDSKATNAEATENALRAYQDIYWILGGKSKEGGIASLRPYFSKITKAYLIGAASDEFAAVLQANDVDFERCGTLHIAFDSATEDALAAGKGVVLLSPARSAVDQNRTFEQRGEFFSALVEAVMQKHPITTTSEQTDEKTEEEPIIQTIIQDDDMIIIGEPDVAVGA
jgi:UDP-N-acetylmuramoylalanine--D-glutamate ligase